MRELLDIISNYIEITGNSDLDSILIALIGLISFSIAFGIVGLIFDALGFYDSDIMSDVHWSIRFIVFLGLAYLLIIIAKWIGILFSFQWWVYLLAGLFLVAIIVIISIIKYKFALRKKSKVCKLDAVISIKQKVDVLSFVDKEHCPICGAKLVKRHGIYGDFYGCENYSINNCKYTRKFK